MHNVSPSVTVDDHLDNDGRAPLPEGDLVTSCNVRWPPDDSRDGGLNDVARRRVQQFVDAHLESRIRLDDLASQAGLGSHYFCALFKRSMGVSPYQYVIERRVARATCLLEDRTLSLAEIAYATGFASQAHLTEVFRRRVGMTPGEYRRQGPRQSEAEHLERLVAKRPGMFES
jgi:AraC-like DNA-binding protein